MKTIDKITHIAICSQVLSHYLQDKIAAKEFKQRLANSAKVFYNSLIDVEYSHYDKFFNKQEESTVNIHDVYSRFIDVASEIPIWEMENFITMWNAYKKSPESIEGICKKILR